MLALAISVGFIALFVGLVALVVRLSGRRFPGDITGDKGTSVDYDDYYVGWNIFGKPDPKASRAPGAPATPGETDDFAQWESEQRKRRE